MEVTVISTDLTYVTHSPEAQRRPGWHPALHVQPLSAQPSSGPLKLQFCFLHLLMRVCVCAHGSVHTGTYHGARSSQRTTCGLWELTQALRFRGRCFYQPYRFISFYMSLL